MSFAVLCLILLTVSLSACAQLALKLGVGTSEVNKALQGDMADIALAALVSPMIWLGLAIYGLSVALWLWVLSRVDLSVAYPFVGISFVLTLIFGALLLDENVGPMRIAGTLLITVGCALVGKSS